MQAVGNPKASCDHHKPMGQHTAASQWALVPMAKCCGSSHGFPDLGQTRSRTVVLERRSDTCSCGWKLLILTGVIIMWHHGVTREAHKVATHGCFLRLSWVQSTLTWHRMVQSPRFGVCAVLAATWAGRGLCKKYCSGSELAPFFDMFGTAGPIFAN